MNAVCASNDCIIEEPSRMKNKESFLPENVWLVERMVDEVSLPRNANVWTSPVDSSMELTCFVSQYDFARLLKVLEPGACCTLKTTTYAGASICSTRQTFKIAKRSYRLTRADGETCVAVRCLMRLS